MNPKPISIIYTDPETYEGPAPQPLTIVGAAPGGGGGAGEVASVNGKKGAVVLTAADVGAATAAQGAKADSAVQPGVLAPVATSGAYTDLTGRPTIPATPADIGAATAAQGTKADSAVQPAALTAALTPKLDKKTTASPQTPIGWWLHLILDKYNTGDMDEPFMVEGFRDGANRRAFWLNENGNPRAASINSEPALKLFGPDADPAYSGALFSILSRYSAQAHHFTVHSDGRFRIGTNSTPASPGVVILTAAEPVPTGLPAGTVIVRKTA